MSATPVPASIVPEPSDPRGFGGLLAFFMGEPKALPLEEVRVRTTIVGDCARTIVEQRFRNDHDVGLEAVHLFPLPDGGAVIEMELRAGELVVKAACRERQEAEQVFATAREQGHRAALLTAERADVHTLRVTNLPPREAVTVRLVVVERLEAVDGALRWRFPTVIAPRYLPGSEIGHEGAGALPDTDRVPDASRLQPPLRLQGGTRLDLEVELAGPVAMLESSLHAVRLGLGDGAVRVAPSGSATLDRDFVLAWRSSDREAASARAWTDGTCTLAIVEPPIVPSHVLPRDAVFVVDISGSMGGLKLEAARRALVAALHGLSPGDRFRLIAFDDRLEQLRPDFTVYDDASLGEADRWIAQLRARGGTEMLPAIRAALEGETPAGRVRTVLFITDGQAHNEAELVAAVANRRGSARFFTLGIDTAVNSALLRRLARVGGGTCELAGPRDDVEAVIARLEARFGSPLVEDLHVEGLVAARSDAEVLFAGRPVGFLLEGAPERIVVRGRTAAGEWRQELGVQPSPLPLGALWARDRVASLEDRLLLRPFEEEALRPEILRVALAHGIASRFTAFVAVETSRTVTGERIEVVQPAELPADWSPAFLAPPAPPPMMAAAPMARARTGAMRASKAKAASPHIHDADPFPEIEADMARPSRPRPSYPAPSPAQAPSGGVGGFAPRAVAPPDPAGDLARSQSADGSFGGDVRRTAAALVALVRLGHTRVRGIRKRTVLKAAVWLAGRTEPVAALALALLEQAERGESSALGPELRALADGSAEGRALGATLPGS